ncbi:MAG: hypothetical protein GY820_37005 [Gammaproteobacteria bacterium]|nr:hypothetical protein [Gammaproteobacteria bacterium]
MNNNNNNNNNNRGYNQQQRPLPQSQPQQNRPQGYGNRQPYANPSVRYMGPSQEDYCENDQNFGNNDPDPDPEYCEIGGPDQYQPHESMDENYFENNQPKYEPDQEESQMAMNNAQPTDNFAQQSYNENTSENVPIYSQVPFQSNFSNENDIWQKIASKIDNVGQKLDGVNQRVVSVEQNLKHSSNMGFRLSQEAGNIPCKNNKNSGSTSNQHRITVSAQGAQLANPGAQLTNHGRQPTNPGENKHQNQHQSRKLQQDFCIQASNSNPPNNAAINRIDSNQQPQSQNFRLSYDAGNVPFENRKNRDGTQNQHRTMEYYYPPKNYQGQEGLEGGRELHAIAYHADKFGRDAQSTQHVCVHA